MISITRRTTGGVTESMDHSMKKNWYLRRAWINAKRSFRRARGHKDVAKLVDALRRDVTQAVYTGKEYITATT
jgi:hypothetical protein